MKETTVAGVAADRWGVRLEPAIARFEEPGWSYVEAVAVPCPRCQGELHCLRKPYESRGRQFRYAALVCPGCPAGFTLADLGFKTYGQLKKAGSRSFTDAAPTGDQPTATRARRDGGSRSGLHITAVTAGGFDNAVQELLGRPSARVIASGDPTSARPNSGSAREDRRLHWVKIGDPAQEPPDPVPGTDLRVLLPDDAAFAGVRERLTELGVPFRPVRYWLEQETITSVTLAGRPGPLAASPLISPLAGRAVQGVAVRTGEAAAAARDAFDLIWDAHAQVDIQPAEPEPTQRHVPAEWLEYLPFATLNPAQVQAAPEVVATGDHVLVVAPTGAGKTVIGMMAALRAVLGEGRKAAWLVPQRSLTDELDRELETWRARGLRVERLSGEYAVDAQRLRDADLWVATTEKFESICRASSMRQALAQVGCLVVDEIHLLGDPARGPVLEALLSRVRGTGSPVRIVGLSATVANASQIAEWLDARPVHVTWRPSRLTWQLPMIAATSDRTTAQAARTRLACAITRMVTDDDGSVLVFCGSKRGVRATALAIAGDRGANTRGVDPDDLDRVHEACSEAGVGLHYKDWDHKRDAERAFRDRELDVLVATSTVAAGVNLPARAVIVRDTQIGLNEIDVALVQQMFGRAGRIGAGETEGWAFLIVDEEERPDWQTRLVAGYHVTSRILATLPDHVLAEAVQGRVTSTSEAEEWWVQTLAYRQGASSLEPLRGAIDLLARRGYLTVTPGPDDDNRISPTDLGILTARLMVPTEVGQNLRTALANTAVPTDPDTAEQTLITFLSVLVPDLAEAPVPEDLRPAVARLLRATGHLDRLQSPRKPTWQDFAGQTTSQPGDLARATLLTAANTPEVFKRAARRIADVPSASMFPILEDAPHYLAWIGAQGFLGTVHPWCAIVAADLARRIRWRRLAPRRGSGRLLWMCEQMATPAHADDTVPVIWRAATSRGLTSPDWPPGAKPTGCRLDQSAYTALLRDRLTGSTLTASDHHVTAECPPGTSMTTWTGRNHTHGIAADDAPSLSFPKTPEENENDSGHGAALFSRRGDHRAIGWLGDYAGHS